MLSFLYVVWYTKIRTLVYQSVAFLLIDVVGLIGYVEQIQLVLILRGLAPVASQKVILEPVCNYAHTALERNDVVLGNEYSSSPFSDI